MYARSLKRPIPTQLDRHDHQGKQKYSGRRIQCTSMSPHPLGLPEEPLCPIGASLGKGSMGVKRYPEVFYFADQCLRIGSGVS